MENLVVPGESKVAMLRPLSLATKTVGWSKPSVAQPQQFFVLQNCVFQYGSHWPHMTIKFKFTTIKQN